MNDLRRARKLDALYAELPRLDCKGECAESCGPIFMSEMEWKRITDRLGYTPEATSLTCPMLTEAGRCSVYDVRPTICRLWGLVEKMRCPWGCVPERFLTDDEAREFLLRANDVGTRSRRSSLSVQGREAIDAIQDASAMAMAAYSAGTYPRLAPEPGDTP